MKQKSNIYQIYKQQSNVKFIYALSDVLYSKVQDNYFVWRLTMIVTIIFVGHKFPVLQMLSKLLVKTVNKHVCQVMNSIKQTCVSSHEKYKTNMCVKSWKV